MLKQMKFVTISFIEPRAILTNIISVFPSAKHVPYFASRKTANHIFFRNALKLCKPASRAREEVHWQAKVAPSENHGREFDTQKIICFITIR